MGTRSGASGAGRAIPWTVRPSPCVESRSSSCATTSSPRDACTWSLWRPMAGTSRPPCRSCTSLLRGPPSSADAEQLTDRVDREVDDEESCHQPHQPMDVADPAADELDEHVDDEPGADPD